MLSSSIFICAHANVWVTLALRLISVKPYIREVGLSGSSVQIRALTADDWEPVSSIYLDGIASGQATFETRPPSWAEWSSGHLAVPRLVATDGGHIVGWAALSPVSLRSVYAGVAEVSVYVRRDCRGQGVGKDLLETLVAESEKNMIWTLQASIF